MLDASALSGLIGSLCLFVPPFRDQLSRLRIKRTRNREAPLRPDGQAVPDTMARRFARLGEAIANGYDRERNSFSAQDTLLMAIGALLLAVSYGLSG
ncbi:MULTISPECIES: hypothetical protein [unclassified Roseitalea]|nr:MULTISPECIES: hypothetical protein [unclassified Roseitalea]